MDPLDVCLAIVELMAFGLNILALYLVSKMDLKDIDIWLGITMAVCDLILSGFKILEFPLLSIFGEKSFLFNPNTKIPLCGVLLFVMIATCTSVGYLGIIRWLVICREYQPDRLRSCMVIYLVHMSVIFSVILLCYLKGGFVQMTNGKYYYTDFHMSNTWGFITSILLLLNSMFCFFSFNGSYMSITRQYLQQLNSLSSYQIPNMNISKEKAKIGFRITFMLILYNLTVVPFFFIGFTELVSGIPRSLTADLVSAFGITCITLINPAMLITMHCETLNEFRKFFTKKTPHYPILDAESSAIELLKAGN